MDATNGGTQAQDWVDGKHYVFIRAQECDLLLWFRLFVNTSGRECILSPDAIIHIRVMIRVFWSLLTLSGSLVYICIWGISKTYIWGISTSTLYLGYISLGNGCKKMATSRFFVRSIWSHVGRPSQISHTHGRSGFLQRWLSTTNYVLSVARWYETGSSSVINPGLPGVQASAPGPRYMPRTVWVLGYRWPYFDFEVKDFEVNFLLAL